MKKLFIAFITFFMLAGIAFAETTVTLQWDANTESDLGWIQNLSRWDITTTGYPYVLQMMKVAVPGQAKTCPEEFMSGMPQHLIIIRMNPGRQIPYLIMWI